MLYWGLNRQGAAPASADTTLPPAHDVPQPPVLIAPPPKAKIALALGGGAARGWAHIGVLRALDEAASMLA